MPVERIDFGYAKKVPLNNLSLWLAVVEEAAPARIDKLGMVAHALSPEFVIWGLPREGTKLFRCLLLMQSLSLRTTGPMMGGVR